MDDLTQRESVATRAVEQDTLDSGKVLGAIKRMLYNGFPVLATFTAGIAVPQPAWTALTLLNGWTNTGAPYATTAAFRIEQPSNRVIFRGLLAAGTLTGGTILFNIPSSRPPWQSRVDADDNGVVVQLQVKTNGDVQLVNTVAAGSLISLDALSYPIS